MKENSDRSYNLHPAPMSTTNGASSFEKIAAVEAKRTARMCEVVVGMYRHSSAWAVLVDVCPAALAGCERVEGLACVSQR